MRARSGGRAETTFGKFFVNLTAKVGLGVNHESVDVDGNTRIAFTGAFPFGPPVTPNNVGGLFAQGSNIGRRTHDEFVVVPEVRLQVGMNLTNNIRIFGGYEFMYLSQVVRPGDQVDHVVNGTQGFGGTLSGVARPAPQFNNSDFWASGLSVGVLFRF